MRTAAPLLLVVVATASGCGGSGGARSAASSPPAGAPPTGIASCARQDLQVRVRWGAAGGGVEAVGGVYNRAAKPCRLAGQPAVIVRADVPLLYQQQPWRDAPQAPATSRPVVLTSGPGRRFAEFKLDWGPSCPAGRRSPAYAHGFVRVPGVSGLLPTHPRAAQLPRCDAHQTRSVLLVSALFAGRPGEAP